MRVSKDDFICGLAAPLARKLMRAYFDDHSPELAAELIGIERDVAEDHLRALEAAGYLQQVDTRSAILGKTWVTTTRGNALAQVSFGKPISRATAERHLTQVVGRAAAYNA